MAPLPGTQHERTYAAAKCFVDQALSMAGSLFSPDRPVWRLQVLADLHVRHASAVDALGDGFGVRWARRLDGAPAESVQLAAEIFYVHLLFATDLSGKTKRRLITETLAYADDPPAVPVALDAALDGGVARTGIAFKLRRMSQLGLLIQAAYRWHQLAPQERTTALEDPWAFKTWLWSIPHEGAQAQREALLHLAHPATFEPIISAGVKQRIVHAQSRHVPAGVDDVDVALVSIRAALERRYGIGFQFIDPAITPLWRPYR
jgi:5-methylcytosine-specific restriction protein B